MKRKTTKLLSLLLSLVLIISLATLGTFTVSAETDGKFNYTVNNGEVTITDCTNPVGEITIPSSINGYPVTSIGYGAFTGCTGLTSIIIPENVTKISGLAFDSCLSLEKIELPKSLTTIGALCFWDCKKLKSIIIPEGISLLDESIFYGCESLETIFIPSSVKKINWYAFSGCENLYEVYYSGTSDDWSKIDIVDYENDNLFYAYKIFLKDIDEGVEWNYDYKNNILNIAGNGVVKDDYQIDSYNYFKQNAVEINITGNVSRIDDFAFYGFEKLKKIRIPNSVTKIGDCAFGSCFSLENITIPDSVIILGQSVFVDCQNLKTVVLSNNIDKIRTSTFHGCTSIKEITIPNNVKSIDFAAFYDCESLKKIILSTKLENIDEMAFWECDNIEDIFYKGTSEEWKSLVEGKRIYEFTNANIIPCKGFEKNVNWEYSPETSTLTISGEGEIKDFDSETPWSVFADETQKIVFSKGIVSIGKRAFSNFKAVQVITLPETINAIDQNAFDNVNENVKLKCEKDSFAETFAMENGIEYYTQITGDTNGDDQITDQDAIYLLFSYYFPDKYPVEQPCDFNNDGFVTDQDAIYLLFHYYFPDEYPI